MYCLSCYDVYEMFQKFASLQQKSAKIAFLQQNWLIFCLKLIDKFM